MCHPYIESGRLSDSRSYHVSYSLYILCTSSVYSTKPQNPWCIYMYKQAQVNNGAVSIMDNGI